MLVDDGAATTASADDQAYRVSAADGVLLGWLLTREAFHLRATTRQTSGAARKRALSRLREVQALLGKFGGSHAHD